jgi:hypothetical protein
MSRRFLCDFPTRSALQKLRQSRDVRRDPHAPLRASEFVFSFEHLAAGLKNPHIVVDGPRTHQI